MSFYLRLVQRNIYIYSVFTSKDGLGLDFPAAIDHRVRPASVSSPCAFFSELWPGSQESQRHSVEKFCSVKLATAEVAMKDSANYSK